jgi:hypothetical protein
MIDSAIQTADDPSAIEFCVYIDADDAESVKCIEGLSKRGYSVKHTTSPTPINLSQMWNYAYETLSTGDLIMLCADDIRFMSRSWDTHVRKAFETHGKFSLVYGDDLVHGRGISTHPFVHREWIRVSGVWLPPYFVSDFVDVWLNDVAKALGTDVYLPHVITEHLHFSVGKSEIDETTQNRIDRFKLYNPSTIYTDKANERMQQVERLRRAIHAL